MSSIPGVPAGNMTTLERERDSQFIQSSEDVSLFSYMSVEMQVLSAYNYLCTYWTSPKNPYQGRGKDQVLIEIFLCLVGYTVLKRCWC